MNSFIFLQDSGLILLCLGFFFCLTGTCMPWLLIFRFHQFYICVVSYDLSFVFKFLHFTYFFLHFLGLCRPLEPGKQVASSLPPLLQIQPPISFLVLWMTTFYSQPLSALTSSGSHKSSPQNFISQTHPTSQCLNSSRHSLGTHQPLWPRKQVMNCRSSDLPCLKSIPPVTSPVVATCGSFLSSPQDHIDFAFHPPSIHHFILAPNSGRHSLETSMPVQLGKQVI